MLSYLPFVIYLCRGMFEESLVNNDENAINIKTSMIRDFFEKFIFFPCVFYFNAL